LFSTPLAVSYASYGIYSIKELVALFALPIILLLPAIPFGIAGALAGRFWRKSRRATWLGAAVGTILGFGVSVLILNILLARSGWDPFAGL